MNEIFKKLSEEVGQKIVAVFATKEMQDQIASIKAAQDNGSFKVIISTPTIDRQGESIDQNGWEMDNYLKNPVLLWAHDYSNPPIGVIDQLSKEGSNTIAEGRFAPTEFAQQIRKLYDAGMMRTVSVGFIAKEMNGNVITKAELLEVSFVPVPANPEALSMRQVQELGLELEMLKTKGLEIQIKEEEVPKIDQVKDFVIHSDDEKKFELRLENGEVKTFILNEGSWNSFKEMEAALAEQKSGRVLSEKNRTLIKSTIDSIQATVTALQELHEATDPQGSEGKELGINTEPQKQGSEPSGSDEALKALSAWLEDKKLRQVLKQADTAITDVLASMREINRKK